MHDGGSEDPYKKRVPFGLADARQGVGPPRIRMIRGGARNAPPSGFLKTHSLGGYGGVPPPLYKFPLPRPGPVCFQKSRGHARRGGRKQFPKGLFPAPLTKWPYQLFGFHARISGRPFFRGRMPAQRTARGHNTIGNTLSEKLSKGKRKYFASLALALTGRYLRMNSDVICSRRTLPRCHVARQGGIRRSAGWASGARLL